MAGMCQSHEQMQQNDVAAARLFDDLVGAVLVVIGLACGVWSDARRGAGVELGTERHRNERAKLIRRFGAKQVPERVQELRQVVLYRDPNISLPRAFSESCWRVGAHVAPVL